MGETILQTLRDTWAGYIHTMAHVLPRLLATASVVAAGWLIAAIAQGLTLRVERLLRFERFSERVGMAELLRKAELPAAERLLAALVFWLLFAGFILAGIDAFGFETLAILRDEVVLLVPRLVTSFAILVVGLILANLAWRVVLLRAVNAGWPSPRLASGFVYSVLASLAWAMALYQVGIARSIVLAAFAIAFGAVLLALAIALGIALAPLVRRLIEERLASRRSEPDGASHL